MKTRKLLISLVLSICLLAQTALPARAEAARSGSGAEGDPIVINDTAGLLAMHNDLSAHYTLGRDIDLSDVDLKPLGSEMEGPFTGTFDGRGHTLSNLTMHLSTTKYVGLFGYLEGSVTNLKLKNVSIFGSRYTGAVAGCAGVGSSITQCQVLSGSVSSSSATRISANVGGIVGMSEGRLTVCANGAAVTGYSSSNLNTYTGGIAGYWAVPEGLAMENCSNSGKIDGGSSTGGIIGYTDGTSVLAGCTNTGEIDGGSNTGGIIGRASTATLTRCSNTGAVDGYDYVGGMIGEAASTATLTGCTNTGTVDGHDYTGGMIGYVGSASALSKCTNTGAITGEYEYVGGMIGRAASTANLTSCSNNGTVDGFRCTGGIIGFGSTMMTGCTNAGNITGGGICLGGLMGSGSGTLTDCVNSGTVGPSNNSSMGGIAGDFSGTLIRCKNSGTIMNISTSSGTSYATYAMAESSSYTTESCVNVGMAVLGGSRDNNVVSIAPGSYYYPYGKLNISLNGVYFKDNTALYCSDLQYPGDGTGYTMAQLQDPDSAAYANWYVDNWTFDPARNSGLPMPNGYDIMDYMDKSVLILAKGESDTLTAPFEVSRWMVDGDPIVTCGDGRVSARSVGATCVSAWSADGRRANCIVYVYEKRASLTLSQSEATVAAGGKVTLTTDLPANDPQGVAWTSEDIGVATVSPDGTVIGVKPGQTTVTATLPLSGQSAKCSVTVTGSTITKIQLTDLTVNVDESLPISRTINSSATYDPKAISWSSGGEAVASVDENGTVTGHKPGMATITATAGSVSGSCTVTVKQPAESVTLDRTELTLEVGLTALLAATVTPENTTDTLSWSSGSSSIASVSDGLVTAHRTGQTVITVRTSSGQTASCSLTVTPATVVPQSVSLSQTILRPSVGEKVQLTASIQPSTATEKSLTWESSAPGVASVSETGVVEALTSGETVITATAFNGVYDQCQVKVVQLSSAAFVLPAGRGAVNESFDTEVQLVKNPGIAAFTVKVEYDGTAMTPVSVKAGNALASGTLTSNVESAEQDGIFRVTWYSDQDITGDGPLFTITWQAKDQSGQFPVTLQYDTGDVCDAEKEPVNVSAEDGSVSILGRPVGDIYQDGQINMKDIVYFARWFNEQEQLDDVQRMSADLVFDGILDVRDLTALTQLLSQSLTEPVTQKLPIAAVSLMPIQKSVPFHIKVSDAVVETEKEDVFLTVEGESCSGVAALRLRIAVPAGYEIQTVQPCEALADSTFCYNSESGIVTWYSESDRQLNGPLFKILLHCVGSVNLPAAVLLDYKEDDFFSAGSYQNEAVTVKPGTITIRSDIFIREAAFRDGGLQITLDSRVPRVSAILVAAIYQDDRMVQSAFKNISLSSDSYSLPVSALPGQMCKIFVLEQSTFAPLCQAYVLTR